MKSLLTILTIICLTAVWAASEAPTRGLLVLSERNTVSLNVPVTQDSVAALQVELLEKSNKLGKNDHIILVLNSPGGDVEAGLKLTSFIKGLPQKVDTLSLFSASMSFIISQQLGERLVMENSTLMSHRARVGGVQGEIPGSYVVRSNYIVHQLERISAQIASRAKMSLPQYQDMIANELWMSSDQAIKNNMADRLVNVRCDSSLNGYGKVSTIKAFIFTINLRFHKCPLITEPEFISGETDIGNLYNNNKAEYFRRYIEPGLFNNL